MHLLKPGHNVISNLLRLLAVKFRSAIDQNPVQKSDCMLQILPRSVKVDDTLSDVLRCGINALNPVVFLLNISLDEKFGQVPCLLLPHVCPKRLRPRRNCFLMCPVRLLKPHEQVVSLLHFRSYFEYFQRFHQDFPRLFHWVYSGDKGARINGFFDESFLKCAAVPYAKLLHKILHLVYSKNLRNFSDFKQEFRLGDLVKASD
jgi:hypothetical protein